MFIVKDFKGYEITRNFLYNQIKDCLTNNLSTSFKGSLLKSIVEEIMASVQFPEIINLDSILVYTDDFYVEFLISEGLHKSGKQYTIEDIIPKFSGEHSDELTTIFEKQNYENILFMGAGVKNPQITKLGENITLSSFNSNFLEDLYSEVLQYFSDTLTNKILMQISKELIKEDYHLIIKVLTTQNFSFEYIDKELCCKQLDLSFEKIKTILLETLPKYNSLRTFITELAYSIHNQLYYECDYNGELPLPYYNKGFVFKKTIHGINFYFNTLMHLWISDYISVWSDSLILLDDNHLCYKGFEDLEILAHEYSQFIDYKPEENEYILVDNYMIKGMWDSYPILEEGKCRMLSFYPNERIKLTFKLIWNNQ